MSIKWCHLNGLHGQHVWRSGLGREYQCPGSPQSEDHETNEDEQEARKDWHSRGREL